MGTIEVVHDASRISDGSAPRCLVLEPGDGAGVQEAMGELGLGHLGAGHLGTGHLGAGDLHGVPPGVHGHPDVKQLEAAVLVRLFGIVLPPEGQPAEPEPWVFVAAPDVLVVIGAGGARDDIVASVEEADSSDTLVALAAAVVGLTRTTAAALQSLAESTAAAEPVRRAFSRASERSTLRALRNTLFALRELFTAQAQLLDVDEELYALTPDEGRPMLKRAHTMFAVGRSTTARLYALAGDLITEQTTLVNERLTLVSTVFLPLTVSTGFFGMNFSWMTDRVGSAAAFVVLGVVVPLLSALLTLAFVRRFGAGSD